MKALAAARHAMRLWSRSPGFYATSIALLALGIGAATALFTIVNSVLLQLPVADADRIVRFTTQDVIHNLPREVSYFEVSEWRRSSRSFDDLAAVSSTNLPHVLDGRETNRVHVAAVTGNFFDVIGASALLGRTIGPADDMPGSLRVTMLSHGLWRTRFGADPSIIGSNLRLNSSSFTVIGIMPASFRYPAGADLWISVVPLLVQDGIRQKRDLLGTPWRVLHGIGRLKKGISLQEAQAELSGLIRPDIGQNERMTLVPFVEDYLGRIRSALRAGFGAALLLLAIACSNVAGLLLARVARRRHEWAMRAALGSTRSRILSLTLGETALVAIPAAVAGALATPLLIRMITSLDSSGHLAGHPVPVNARVLAVIVGVAIATIVVAGIAPALHAITLGARVAALLTVRSRPPSPRLRRWLVGMQAAVAVILLAGAGLMIRSVTALNQVDLGFNIDRLLVVTITEPQSVARMDHRAAVQTMLERLTNVPGVTNVAGVYRAPLQGPIGLDSRVLAEGDPLTPESLNLHPPVNAETITHDYFAVMGIRLLAGRYFTVTDRDESPGVVIVSQSLANEIWPGQDAVGKRLLSFLTARPVRSPAGEIMWQTVVGVVNDVRYHELERARFDVYVPVTQSNWRTHDVVVRSTVDPSSLAQTVRLLVESNFPGSAVHVRTMKSMFEDATSSWRMTLIIIGVFACFALVLTATGIYALLVYVVEERTREIGIRVALGAEPNDVRRFVVTNAAGLVGVGVIVGLIAFSFASAAMQRLVFEVATNDPLALLASALLVIFVATAAAYLAASRATGLHPSEALRTE